MPVPSGTQPRQPLVLAVDCGSTNFKAAVFNADLCRLAEKSSPVPYTRKSACEVELDPSALLDLFDNIVRETCADAGLTLDSVNAVALASQAQTFTVIGPGKTPLTPFISWLDTRASDEAAELTSSLGATFHQHCSWPRPVPEHQLTQLLWLSRHQPDALRDGCKVLPLPSFLASRWTGRFVIDHNLSAMHCLYSQKSRNWWDDALHAVGITPSQLPDLVDVGATVSPRDPSSPRVVFAGNDQTAGAFGNRCEEGHVLVTLGTALVAYRFAGDEPGPYGPAACWGPYPFGGYYEMAVRTQGCLALDWARDQLMPGTPVADFDEAVVLGQRSSTADTPLFYPDKIRSGSPWTAPADVPAAAFATLEGISFCLRDLIFVELGLCPDDTLHVIGGGSRSDAWLQIISDVTGCRVRRGAGDSLLGAARMASTERVPSHPSEGTTICPNPSRRALCEQRYVAWKKGAAT
ncbi:MAG: FGGY-family carbohydrate kinase [Lentisphaerae bacterium]|nr:FGGY-family carbohydrate kinase [Lentisphaerota bacterium]